MSGAPSLGSETAKIGIVEFSDFQCPFCSRLARDVWPAIKSDYVDTGKVRIFFRHYPLTAVHPQAFRAAEAAECASRQNLFWEMHDALFRRGIGTDDTAISQTIAALHFDRAAFAQCMDGGARPVIERDLKMARDLGLTGTPVLALGLTEPNNLVKIERMIQGLPRLEELRSILGQLLSSSATN
jgi:protein-disulfide isomerase